MYLADSHIHSTVSHDGRLSMGEIAEAYITLGFDEICFTDHVDAVDWRTNQRIPSFHWEELERQYREARETAGERIKLRLGVELGAAPWDREHTERLMAEAPELDFIIGSMHMLSKRFHHVDLIAFAPADEAEAHAGIRDSLEQVLELARWGKFSVLGHISLVLRYLNQKRGYQLTLDGYEAEMAEIFRTLIQNGCGLELNTNRGSEPLPTAKWLRMYRELGGEIITLGSDAHGLQHMGSGIRECQELLRRCGYKRFCTFERMQPVWHAL